MKCDFTVFSPVSGRGLGLRAPPGRAGARLAVREPDGAKGEGRGRWTRSQVPGQAGRAGRGGYRRRRPVSQSRRCPLGAAAETAGTGPREEPQPQPAPGHRRLQAPEAEVSLCSPMEHPILRLPVARDTSARGPLASSQSRITSRLPPPEEPRVSIPASFTKSER